MLLRDVRIPRSVLTDDRFGGRLDGECLRGDLEIHDGVVVSLVPSEPTDTPRMVIPKLIEAHCHLDKCHTAYRMGPIGGDLNDAIRKQAEDRLAWTEDDLARRAQQGLNELQDAGCMSARSHVDWGDTSEPPLAWHVLPALDHGPCNMQWAALTGIDQLAEDGFAQDVASHVAQLPGGVLGSFILDQAPDTIRHGLRACFEQAERRGLPVDFHVDETLADRNGVELIADVALETRFQGPIHCGHAVSLMQKSEADIDRISNKLARAGITICALPTTNLYLQGRLNGTPDRRGITRLRELAEAGVSVTVGSDNVGDAFCPLGQHDPMAALNLACLTAHLDPPLEHLLPMVTTVAARALGLEQVTVDAARAEQLLISPASDITALISGRAPLSPLPPET